MAVYAGSGQRRRTTGVIAIVALTVGLVIGVAIGSSSGTSIDEQIATGRDGGRGLVTALRVLPLEYEQAFSGSSESGLISDTVKRSTSQLATALTGAPWLTSAQRDTATEAVHTVEAAARNKVTPARFETVIARSTATLQSVFGLPASAAG